MTHKDYKLFADALKKGFPICSANPRYEHEHYYKEGIEEGYAEAVKVMCEVFKQDNPNFDGDKFLAALRS